MAASMNCVAIDSDVPCELKLEHKFDVVRMTTERIAQ